MTNHLPDWVHALHHDGSEVYVSNLTPQQGETVTITLRAPLNAPFNHVYIRTIPDGEPSMKAMTRARKTGVSEFWEVEIPIRQPVNYYSFKIMTDEGAYYYNQLGVRRWQSVDDWDFKILANYRAPSWVRDQVYYQIFPDRFNDGDPTNNVKTGEYEREGHKTKSRTWGEVPYKWEKAGSMDFFGGDLQGIIDRLDYLQSVGVTGVYLCPIFDAESNHRYDITDFFNVSKHLGGNEALADLRKALDERDMTLILDITPNHISFHHPWFLSAQADPNSPFAAYFARDDESGGFETWLGTTSLIKLNYASDELREIMYRGEDSALKVWLDEPYRIDGWRLDVANMTGNLKMDQLDHEVHREMHDELKAKKADLYLLGEHFHDATPHTQGDELDATMNYQGFNIPIRRWLGGEDLGVADGHAHGDTNLMPSEAAAAQMQHFMGAVPYVIALQQFNQLGSHDTTRILHVTKGDEALAKLGATLLLTFPGVPCLYYGDEIGMTGGKDPDNRRCFPWEEAMWNQDILTTYQQLIKIRQDADALRNGGFQILSADGDYLAFTRQSNQQTLLIVAYRGDTPAPQTSIPVVNAGVVDGAVFTDLLTQQTFTVTHGQIVVEGLSHGQALILEMA